MPNIEELVEWGDMDIAAFQKGNILKIHDLDKENEDTVHYQIKHMRNIMGDIYKLYSGNKKPTKKDFSNLFEKHEKKLGDDVDNFLELLENEDELMKVISHKLNRKTGETTIKLQRVDTTEKKKLVKSISKKLATKLTKEQLISLLEEGVRKNNDVEQLKLINQKLKKKKPKVEGIKGCFKVVVDEEDVFVMR